jgi:hypothetical protein
MSTVTTVAEAARRELTGFSGRLIGPGDADYDEARTVFNAMIDRRPALIARCADAGDVAAAIGFARRHDLLLAVRGGGHNGGGLGVCDDGVVVDLSALRTVEPSPDAHEVRVGGGCTWHDVDAATHPYGQAVPCGIISTTGVGGLTLGGGLGHLARGCGLTIDSLLEAEMVLADGSLARASANENPDLFWAIRGGGGNFGVVTSFRFRTYDARIVQAGPTFWPIEQTPEVFRAYREFLPAARRELTGFAGVMTVPPAPLFPEELHMRKVACAVWCYNGPDEEAAEAIAPMQAVGNPLLHAVGPIPLPELNSLFDGLYCPGLQWYWRGDFVRELPDEAIEKHLEWGEKLPTMHSTMHLYPIDGAVHDVGESDTAWAYRDVHWAQVIVGVDPDPANAGLVKQWTVDYWDATHPYSAGGGYVNFMMEESQARVKATYRGNYERLTRVKATYDPHNVFRVNQNIVPAA